MRVRACLAALRCPAVCSLDPPNGYVPNPVYGTFGVPSAATQPAGDGYSFQMSALRGVHADKLVLSLGLLNTGGSDQIFVFDTQTRQWAW